MSNCLICGEPHEEYGAMQCVEALQNRMAALTAERDMAYAARDVAMAAQNLQLKISDHLASERDAARKALIAVYDVETAMQKKGVVINYPTIVYEQFDAALSAAKG
jgi:hypothetical protein